jgi:hypothetical protein
MKKQKKIFLAAAFCFLGLLVWASYDISTRTTFPGSKGQLKERINDTFLSEDSLLSDSVGKIENFKKTD